MAFQRPYFFEEHFPASYHLTFAPPVQHHPGKLNYPRQDLDKLAHMDKEGYHLYVDVKDYEEDEISVRTIDETIIVEGKQKKRPGSNALPRHFVRHFKLPENFDSEDVFSAISDDGILEIKCLPPHLKRCRPHIAPTAEEKK